MMDRHLWELLNDQFNKELYSAYLYMDFADYYHARGLHGFGNWYDVQVQEERDHAMLIRAWMLKRGETIELLPIAKPDKTITGNADPLHFALAHEQYVTGLIHTLHAAAEAAGDADTAAFLNWFVNEQVEEEENATTMITHYDRAVAADSLELLDITLKHRRWKAPSLTVDVY